MTWRQFFGALFRTPRRAGITLGAFALAIFMSWLFPDFWPGVMRQLVSGVIAPIFQAAWMIAQPILVLVVIYIGFRVMTRPLRR